VLREVAARLGEVPFTGDRPAPGADAYCVQLGSVARHGLLIEINWVSFCDVRKGLPAMTAWLNGLHCRQFKYDLTGSWLGSSSDPDGPDDVPD
jgi:hypothetical protein